MSVCILINAVDVPRPPESGLQVLEIRISLHLELAIRGFRHTGSQDVAETACEGL